jgi:hypothetical protein
LCRDTHTTVGRRADLICTKSNSRYFQIRDRDDEPADAAGGAGQRLRRQASRGAVAGRCRSAMTRKAGPDAESSASGAGNPAPARSHHAACDDTEAVRVVHSRARAGLSIAASLNKGFVVVTLFRRGDSVSMHCASSACFTETYR